MFRKTRPLFFMFMSEKIYILSIYSAKSNLKNPRIGLERISYGLDIL